MPILTQGRLKKDLWSLISGRPQVDPDDLATAIEDQVRSGDLDYRTRLLIRDSIDALKHYWGEERLLGWLGRSPLREEIEAICRGEFEKDEVGFPSLKRRLMDATKPEHIQQYFRELSQHVRRPIRLEVAGAIALILTGYLSRKTEDVDVINEVPPELRNLHKILDELTGRFGLELGHVQSHYFPKGWRERIHWIEPFGQIQVYLVDVYDIFLSKLFSARTKDRDDLRLLAPQLDKETIIRRFRDTTTDMLAAPDLKAKAENNWQYLYGEPLPT